jgi:energy-coupling factor transporter transmembrane protein EcfT
MKSLNDWRIIILLCLILGLAPFLPEPHILGKIRWIAVGANGMTAKDYFDVVLHGFPFVLLIRLIYIKLIAKNAA